MRTPRLALLLCLLASPLRAEVVSETLLFLEPDGRHYLLLRSIHSNSESHRFHLPASVRREDLLYVSPPDYLWDDSPADSNILAFDSGGFTLIYRQRFTAGELTSDEDGRQIYRSASKTPDTGGHFGYWYAPGDFDRYSYGWIVPPNIEILSYRSNVQGQWTRSARGIGFHARNANDIVFEIHYRVKAPPVAAHPAASGKGKDSDGDGVGDGDLCPQTPPGARVDRAGCPLDADRDGVPDGIDRCPGTPGETPVDSRGCASTAGRDERSAQRGVLRNN